MVEKGTPLPLYVPHIFLTVAEPQEYWAVIVELFSTFLMERLHSIEEHNTG